MSRRKRDPSELIPAGLQGVMFVRFRPRPTHLAMPDACCDLVWVGEELYLAGPATRGQSIRWPGQDIELVNVDPLVTHAWLGTPLSHLVDRRVPLRDIRADLCGPLEELFHSGQAASLVPTREHRRRPATRASTAAAAIRAGMSVDAAASGVALSARQLERVFDHQFGLTPRLYRRIVRLRRAVELAATGSGLAAAAIAAGYADQSHFTREVTTMMGSSPRSVVGNVGKVQDTQAYARDY